MIATAVASAGFFHDRTALSETTETATSASFGAVESYSIVTEDVALFPAASTQPPETVA